MLPSYIDEATRSPGEYRVFRMLATEEKAAGWIVLHSVNIARHTTRPEGEADFVVVVPGLGVLVLEVKASKHVLYESGQWVFGQNTAARSPFRQASDAMHSLRRYLLDAAPELRHVLFYSAVVFSHVRFCGESPEWHSWQIIDIDKLALRPLAASVEAVLTRAHRHISTSAFGPRLDPNGPSVEDAERIAGILRPRFEAFEHPRDAVKRLEESLLTATFSQIGALDAMAENARVIFTGPAGTGKTVLALEAAKREAASHRRVLVSCFNRMVGDQLQLMLRNRDNIVAGTLHRHMLRVAGIERRQDTNFWRHELPDAATRAVLEEPTGAGLFDALVIDEAQDLLVSDYLDYLDASLVGGLRNGRWLMFGDFNNQAIYEGELDLPGFLESYDTQAARFRLAENCRNTPRIVERIRLLCELDPDYSRVVREDDGVNPQTLIAENRGDATKQLERVVGELKIEGFRNDEIVILSFRRDDESLASCVQEPRVLDSFHFGRTRQAGRIHCCTVHAFKGMEAPAVVITDVESLDASWSGPLLYTALSRPQHRLVMILSKQAGEQLRRAL